MRRHSSALARLAAAGLAFLLASAVAVLAAPAPVAAHGSLAMSTPASGATVDQPMATVELYFTERVAANAYFAVTAPGGKRVDDGWTHGEPKPLAKPVREYLLVDGKFEPREYPTGFPAVVTVAHLPAVGQYSVSYLSVATDGEPVRGTMSFRYTGRVTAPPAGWRPPTNQPDPLLVAAAERHDTVGHQGSSAAAPAPSVAGASPPAVASAAPADEDGPGGLVWAGAAVAVALAVTGYLWWRRRPAPVRAGPARGRGTGASVRRRGGSPRPVTRTGSTARGGKGRPDGNAGKRRPEVGVAQRRPDVVTDQPVAVPVRDVPDGPRPSRLSDARLALLVGGVLVALLAGFGIGRIGTGDASGTGTASGSVASLGGAPGAAPAGSAHQHAPGTGAHTHPGEGGASGTQVAGTTVSAGGYTMQPVQRTQPAGVSTDYRFRIVGTDGQPATRFAVVHDRPLHLIVVSRDLGDYQHLHPTMADDGTWQVALRLARPGGYRVYADFSVTTADGTNLPLVLGVDHQVPGAHTPATLPPPRPQSTAGPFAVSLDGTPTVGVSTPMVFRVGPGPVRLERYLGAYGHLVVIREGDLGYVHVHPEAELTDGAVTFWLTAPSLSRYRAFFDFQVEGKVHTAAYTLNLP